MTIDEYTQEVKRTSASELPGWKRMISFTLGLCGESGEFAELVKKEVGHNIAIGDEQAKRELGDVLWYWFALCDVFGFDPAEVMQVNVDKLRKRYPDGFTPGGGNR